MRVLLVRGMVLGCLLALMAPMTGCRSAGNDTSAQAAKPPPMATATPGRKAAAGAAPDMNDYAAPAGVKTGVLPGGQK